MPRRKLGTGEKEFDLCSDGRYYKNPCCGWRNQVGRSQPGGWHVSVGDEVKAAFKQLCVDPRTHIYKYTKCHKQTKLGRHQDGHKEGRADFLMCSLMQSKDKLPPLKAKPNQTWTVISVTVVFGFKTARLTSDKHLLSHTQEVRHACNCAHAN